MTLFNFIKKQIMNKKRSTEEKMLQLSQMISGLKLYLEELMSSNSIVYSSIIDVHAHRFFNHSIFTYIFNKTSTTSTSL